MERKTLRGVVYRSADDLRLTLRVHVGLPRATPSGMLTPVAVKVRQSRHVDEEGVTFRRIRSSYRFTFDQRGQVREARYEDSWVQVDGIAREIRITDTFTYTVTKLGDGG